MTTPPILDDIAGLAASTDAWLCDIWGVLHNGAAAIPGAAEACAAFRRQGGRVLLVSNAPRPAADVAKQLAGLGITVASYDGILTSGDVARDLMATEPKRGFFHLGPARHRVLFQGLADQPVAEANARHVVCTGLDERRADEHPDEYRDLLSRLARRGLPLLCANPDVKVDAGGAITWCAGALAAIYAELGGEVAYAGKPHPAVYTAARARLAMMPGGPVADARLLAIGDGVETDLRGAHREGIRAVYIASRIHMSEPLTATSLAALCTAHDIAPTAAMSALRWNHTTN
jgi:HAD superfamily hydrolase (TIGR01459 family)